MNKSTKNDSLRIQAKDLTSQMTLEEKIRLTAGRDPWSTVPLPRLELPWIWMADGPHGLRRAPKTTQMGYGDQLPATCFPTASALAASWDTDLLYTVGGALAAECRDQGVDVLLGPGVNIKRSPLGGRNFEYFSEDPQLTGELGAAYIQGLQDQGVGACLKHFAANNTETRRMHTDSVVDQRTLREIYLKPFEIAVKKSQPWTVMACYNRVNGIYGTQNPVLLTQILQKEWGFHGVTITDWDAIVDRVEALKAGLSLQMPGGEAPYSLELIKEAVQKGTLEESLLDDLVENIVALVLRCKSKEAPAESVNYTKHHLLAREIAGQCITLLKNDSSLLPLSPHNWKSRTGRNMRVAVIGGFAKHPRYQGNGSSEVKPSRIDTFWDVLTAEYGDVMDLEYHPGYGDSNPGKEIEAGVLEEAARLAARCDAALILAGLPLSFESEGIDRTHLHLPVSHNQVIQRILEAQKQSAVILSNGSAVTMPWIDQAGAVLESWVLGQAGAGAVADVVFGHRNPSGKLAETFPLRIKDHPSFLNFPGEAGEVLYGERVFVGYRYFDTKGIPPLFPFGHGLSYTRFEYLELSFSRRKWRGGEDLVIRTDISNIGGKKGQEVVQLYVAAPSSSSVRRPHQELRRFAKITLCPGETKTVEFTLNQEDLSFYDPARKSWIAESGRYEIHLGSSSRDIRLRQAIEFKATEPIPIVLDEYAFIADLWKHEETRKLLCQTVPRWLNQFVPPGKTLREADMEDFLAQQPLIKLPHLTRGEINASGVAALTAQCRLMTYIP